MDSDTSPPPLSHAEMLRLWPSRKEFVEGLGAVSHLPVVYPSVQSWETRNRIPEKYWPVLIAYAHDCGFGDKITLATLKAADEAKPRLPRRPRARPASAAA